MRHFKRNITPVKCSQIAISNYLTKDHQTTKFVLENCGLAKIVSRTELKEKLSTKLKTFKTNNKTTK